MIRLERNSPCWCGSGKKYKACHWKQDKQSNNMDNNERIPRSDAFVEGMRKAGKLASEGLKAVGELVKPGVSTLALNDFVHTYFTERGAICAPLNYRGFPMSICTSRNEVICHGIPSADEILQDGDIISIDVTCILDGYHGDTASTFFVGNVSPMAKKLTDVTRSCLELGIAAVRPYGYVGDIGEAIQTYAHKHHFSVVEVFVGHGIGTVFHESLQIPHYGRRGKGERLLPGMFFTIEPMINEGVKDAVIMPDKWTAKTADNKLSAQFEHTLYLSEKGVEILTK